MNIVDSLLSNNQEEFRNQIHAALYAKIKDALAEKKVEIASSLYNIDEECESCNEEKEEDEGGDDSFTKCVKRKMDENGFTKQKAETECRESRYSKGK